MAFCWWWRICCLMRKVKKKGSGGGWTSFWPLSPFAKTRWGGRQRHCPQPSPGGWNWNMNLFPSGFFFFFLHCFVINQETLGRKITISLYPPFTLTRWTGLLECGFYNVKSCWSRSEKYRQNVQTNVEVYARNWRMSKKGSCMGVE